jgi:hypothetical protein
VFASLVVGLLPACSGGSAKPTISESSSAVVVINPSTGGTLKLGSGFVLEVPAGALSAQSRVAVTASDALADLPLAASVGPAYDVDLGGASLRNPATVTIPVQSSGLPAGAAPADVFLARYDQASASWEPLASKVDATAGTISASVDHFSKLQAFAAKVKAAAAAFLDLYTKGLQAVGIRAAPPTCASPPPAGVTFSLVPKSLAKAPSVTVPAANLVHLVLGCADAIAGDQVKVKVANNRSYAQLLVPGQGVQVSVDHVDNGSVSETLGKAIGALFGSKGVYLPGTGEADLTVTVPAGMTKSLETQTSQLTLFIDGGLRLIDVFVPETHKADAAKCLYDAAATNGAVPPLRDVAKIAKSCITPFATGVAAVLLGPVSLYIESQMQSLVDGIDSSANAIVGDSESVQVTVAAMATTTTTTTTTTAKPFPIPALFVRTGYERGALYQYPSLPDRLGIDNHEFFSSLNWTQAGATQARLMATLNQLECVPDCARGTYTSFPVEIVLSNPKTCALTLYADYTDTTRVTDAYVFSTIVVNALTGTPRADLVGNSVLARPC